MQEQALRNANHSYAPFDVEAETSAVDIETDKDQTQVRGISVLWNIVQLNPGVSKLNFFCCVLFYCSMVFGFAVANALQPLILTDPRYYNLSADNIGSLVSLLMMIQLVIKVVIAVPYGHMVDKFGRRNMILYGSVCYLISFVLVPLQTTVFPGLVSAKILLANATTCFHSVPLMADYIANESRGRASAMLSMAIGVSSIIANVSVNRLLKADFSIGSCYIIFGIGVSLVMMSNALGLKSGHYYNEGGQQQRPQENTTSLKQNVKEALEIFKQNGWLSIGLTLQILGSSDFMVFFMFMSIYVRSLFPASVSPKEASITITYFHILVTLVSFFGNVFYGWFLDRKNKPLVAAYIALAGGIVAFYLVSMSGHPDDWTLYLGTALVGATLPGLFVITNFINIKNFPPEKRGIMISFTGLAGNISHFLIASGGGLLYDHISKVGPFILCAILLKVAILLVKYFHKTKIVGRGEV